MKTAFLICLLCVAPLLGCARTAATTWGYSGWYRQDGAGVPRQFEVQKNSCLATLGLADPASVQPDSPQENSFIDCMNGAGWCSEEFECNKPGAS